MKKFTLFAILGLILLQGNQPIYAQTHIVEMKASLPSAYANIYRMKLANNGPIPAPTDVCQTGEVAMFTTLIFQCNGAGHWELLDNVWVENDAVNTVSLRNPSNLPLGVSIGTDLKEFKLTISNDGGIIAKGTKGSGATLTTTGDGARLIWYPKKASFLAGDVSGSQWDDESIGDYSVAFGKNNTVKMDYSVIGGGYNNIIDTSTGNDGYEVIGGGRNNSMFSLDSVIAGGNTNVINNTTSRCTIGGGSNNTISAGTSVATIAGGDTNTASGDWDFIGGGSQNNVNGGHGVGGASVIGGGYQNSVNNYRNFIGGGGMNTITGAYNVLGGGQGNSIDTVGWGTIGGGSGNQITGGRTTGTISGGGANQVSSNYGIIGGGNANNVSGDLGTISGGGSNQVSSNYGIISGGNGNNVSGDLGAIVGGAGNIASGGNSFVGGGTSNHATGNNSTIAGGDQNQATNLFTSVGGGQLNQSTSNWTTVAGGHQNTASGFTSSILGGSANTASGNNSVVLGGNTNTAAGILSMATGASVNVTGDRSMGFGGFINVQGDDSFVFATSAGMQAINVLYSNTFSILTDKVAIGEKTALPVILPARLNVWRNPANVNDVAVSINDVMQLTPRLNAPGNCTNADLGKIYVDTDQKDICFCNSNKWAGLTTGAVCN